MDGNFVGSDLTARFGPFSLDRQQRSLMRDGRTIHLTPKAFDLLLLLVDQAPRIVAKAELHERLWTGTFVSDATLVGLIKELRRALDDRDTSDPIIRTVNRVGYGFARQLDRTTVRGPTSWHWLVGRETRFPLNEGENVIGRDPDSSVWLDVASVSRRHARIAVEQNAATLEDLQSKNGTKLGAATITSRVTLQNGDQIVVGTVPLTYRSSVSGFSTETQISAVHDGTQLAESAGNGASKRRKSRAI